MSTESTRSKKAKINIYFGFLIKGINILVNFLLVPLILSYLNQSKYGIWLTLSSILFWLTFFEIGVSNGLRNKLAEALAISNYKLGKKLVSTAYAFIGLIMVFVLLISLLINQFIDWPKILNCDVRLSNEITTTVNYVLLFVILKIIFKIISSVLLADQKPALASIFEPFGSLISLGIVYFLTTTQTNSLIFLGFAITSTPVLVLFISTLYLFSSKYKSISPSLKYVDFNYVRQLLSLGGQFFIIQLSGFIIFQSSNIIIVQYFGPENVTVFNIAYKYFSIINILATIIFTPFWSAFTEAWIKREINWIRRIVKKLVIIWISISLIGFIMLLFSREAFLFWVGPSIEVPSNLSILLLVYFIVLSFGNIFNMFINGVGKVKLQMYSSAIGSLIFILVSIYLAGVLKLGMVAIVIASILANFFGLFLAPIQYKKIINYKAYGIWNK